MKLEDAIIDLDSIKNIESELNDEYLKVIHSKYCDSVEQVLTMISSPLILMSFAITKTKETHLSIKSAVKLGYFLNNPPTEPKDAALNLIKFFFTIKYRVLSLHFT